MYPASERSYSAREIRADRWVHRVGIGAGLIASSLLVVTLAGRHDAVRLVVGVVYASGLMAMLSFSAAYNLAPSSPRKALLQRWDHAAIFAMIAGTYTPFLVLMTTGATRWALLVGLWLVVAIGSALEFGFQRRREGLAVLAYLLMGWVPLLILAPLYETAAPRVLVLLAAGGVIYTLGVLFHLWEALPYHKAIWHGMVLAAASVHYGAVLIGILAGTG